jgi:hypothetical protein
MGPLPVNSQNLAIVMPVFWAAKVQRHFLSFMVYFSTYPHFTVGFCDPGEIRTPNLLIRSQMLYPIKLRDPAKLQFALRGAKISIFPTFKADHDKLF